MPDWPSFFTSTIEAIQDPLSIVLAASGCREGWLQGELFRAGRRYDLRVNEYSLGERRIADLSCGNTPEMLAEIKMVGADYSPKMQTFIESDVAGVGKKLGVHEKVVDFVIESVAAGQ